MSFLKTLGNDLLAFFTFGEKVAAAAAPFITIANPAIGGLFTATLSAVTQAQALGEAASANGSTDAQKLASVVSAITPTVTQTLIGLGVPADKITNATITAYTNAFVALLNTLPAPTTTPALTAASTPAVSSAAPAAPQVATSGALTGVGVTQPATPAAFVPAAPAAEVAHESALGKIGHGIADVFTGKAEVKV